MQTLSYRETAEYLKTCEDVWILVHGSPDGDAVGTGFALRYLLEDLGKRARVVCPDEIPSRYAAATAPDCDFPAKAIIAVDLGDLKLLGSLEADFTGRVDCCIDHHLSNVHYAARLCLNADASAACEVLYEIMLAGGLPVTDRIAACLYMGIATDTGCFKFENASPRAHEITAELKRTHALPYAAMNRALFDIKSRGRLRMEQVITEQMHFHLDGACTVICVPQALLASLNADPADMEGISSLALQVEGVEVGVTIKEKEDGLFRLSLRSAGDANVARICTALGGGGHAKAAGCSLHCADMAAAEAIIVAAVNQELAALA